MSVENTRPKSFKDFVGQEQPKKVLEILCRSAQKQNKPMAHALLSGPAGLGKTTLCHIIAHTLGSRLIEVIGSNLSDPQQLQSQLASLKERDVLFIDEIHSLPKSEEILYSAMEDGTMSWVPDNDFDAMMKSLGMGKAKNQAKTMTLPPFTLIGATTMHGMLSAPLRDRFTQSMTLDPYTVAELQQIVVDTGRRMSFEVSKPMAEEIARRSRNTARIAVGHLSWLKEYCCASDIKPSVKAVREAFVLKDIDENGLTKLDRMYFQAVCNSPEPIGLSCLAASLGENEVTLAASVEPFLLREGYIRRTSRGRVPGDKSRELMECA